MVDRLIQVPLEKLDAGSNVRTPKRRLALTDYGLRQSIREHGVLQPITVTRNGARYEVLYGHRRTQAARDIGLKTIPAMVVDAPKELEIRQLVENEHRQRVDPVGIARTLRAYLDEHPQVTQGELAAKVGKSSYWISTKLVLLELDEGTQRRISTGEIGATRAVEVHKATTVQEHGKGRPRILALESEDSQSASVVVPLASMAAGSKAGKATISVERGSGQIELVVEDGSGYGIMVTLTAPIARILGLRLTQASQAVAPAAAAASA